MRLLPQTFILRFPKISAAYALKFLTAAPYPARFFRHWRRFAGYAPQGGETVAGRGYLSNLNCRRSSRQQIFNIPRRHDLLRSATHPQAPSKGAILRELPPPRTDFHTIGHIAELSYQGGSTTATTKNGARRTPPYRRRRGASGRILSAPAVSRQFSAAQMRLAPQKP